MFTRWRWHRDFERYKFSFVISHGNVILPQTSEFKNGLGSQGLHLSRYQQHALSGQFEIPFLSLVKPFIKDYFILESCLSNTWLSVWANTFLWNSCLQVFHNQDGEWGADVCVDVSLSHSQSIYQMKEESGWWQMFSCLCSCYIKGDQVDIPPSPRGWGCRHHHRSRSTVSLRMRKCTSLTVTSLLYLNKVCSTLHIKSLYTVHQVTVHILKRYRLSQLWKED